MSRIGKDQLAFQVTIAIEGHTFLLRPKGELSRVLPAAVTVEQSGETLLVLRRDESRSSRQHTASAAPGCQHGEGSRRDFRLVSKFRVGYWRRFKVAT